MFSKIQKSSFYLFALSNFLAAFGGGTILGKGIHVIHLSFLKSGFVLAFLIGTALFFFFRTFVPKKISRVVERWFSVLCSLTSIGLLTIFLQYSVHGKLFALWPGVAFFSLLSIRFALWFYSRTLRVSNVAAQQHTIAFVEFGYYAGMIMGMVVWPLLGLGVGMAAALMIDVGLQLCAGVIDVYTYYINPPAYPNIHTQDASVAIREQESIDTAWCWRLVLSAALLTVGTQGVIFDLAHYFSENFSPYILACFYLGASIAAIACKKLHIRLDWQPTQNAVTYACLCFTIMGRVIKIRLLYVIATFTFFEILTVMLVSHLLSTNPSAILLHPTSILGSVFLIFIFAIAFFGGILLLAILDRIGIEEKNTSNKKMVVRAYGLMGVCTAAAFWMMGFLDNILIGLTSIFGGCFIFIAFALYKRPANETADKLMLPESE